jgi:hypothetical protein
MFVVIICIWQTTFQVVKFKFQEEEEEEVQIVRGSVADHNDT